MPKYTTVVFDLDGTLIDSGPGIMDSVAAALRGCGCPVPPRETLRLFVGPSLLDGFQKISGMDLENATKAIKLYREYYHEAGMFSAKVYEGIPGLLARLRQNGIRAGICTSKPEPFAILVLKHFGLYGSIDFVAGALLDNSRADKPDVMNYAKTAFGLGEGSIMVGDRKYDIDGARHIGIPVIGVLYGYGSREEIERHAPDSIAASVGELSSILLEETPGAIPLG